MEPAAIGTSADTGRAWVNAGSLLAGLRPLSMFCGGFGSGKTEVAVNFALSLVADGGRVAVADLDIVNPYFRSRGVRQQLTESGIDVILPAEALMEADLPVIQPEVRGALARPRGRVVLDLGGDPVGARVMASLADAVRPEDLDGFFVLNSRRPLTLTAEGAAAMMGEVSRAAAVPVTGIVVNSHLIEETTPGVIAEGIELADELASRTGVPVAFAAIERRMLDTFDVSRCPHPVMVLERLMLKPWEPSNWLGRRPINS
ncbi:cobalamin biosynthesis protein CbiA [candidate division WOR-3 bacterium]|nr:cobalamin biosynthesis protein CbiA [candidate division WOR-3 bacterium]